MWRSRRVCAAALVVGSSVPLLSACGDGGSDLAADEPPSAVSQRVDAIDAAVANWRAATTIDEAQAAAETAANLVVGPSGPGYGDRDGDGEVGGESGDGLLPGLEGRPPGLASQVADGNECVGRDVLGGDWTDPGARWDEMLVAIDAWTPARNTMPSLASHPMRIVGWATFTLATDDLSDALEYGGHARLHVDVTARAVDC